MKKQPYLFHSFLVLLLAGCSLNNDKVESKDLIQKGIKQFVEQQDTGVEIKKTVYLNENSESKKFLVTDWKKELSAFSEISFTKISKQGDLVFDTTLDQRTNRYLIRGMRLENGPGFQNLFVILDSNRRLLQFKALQLKEGYFSNSQIDYFWSTEGEYQYRKVEQRRFRDDTKIEIIAEW